MSAFARVSRRAYLSFKAVSFDSDCDIGFEKVGLIGLLFKLSIKFLFSCHGQRMVRVSGKCITGDLKRKYPTVDFSMFNLVQQSVINSSAPLIGRHQQYSASLFTTSSLRCFESKNGYPLERLPISLMTHSKFFQNNVAACRDEQTLSLIDNTAGDYLSFG